MTVVVKQGIYDKINCDLYYIFHDISCIYVFIKRYLRMFVLLLLNDHQQ